MPLTYSGRLVTPDGTEAPTLLDIAIGLSRQPRFAGQTRVWWSVLDHTLFCDDLLTLVFDLPLRPLRLGVLLHDAHESLTGDVPTPLKTPDFKAMQDKLDRLIYDAHYYPGGYTSFRAGLGPHVVHDVDRAALNTEAYELLPHPASVLMPYFTRPGDRAVEVLDQYRWGAFGGLAPQVGPSAVYHPAVQEFLRRMRECSTT